MLDLSYIFPEEPITPGIIDISYPDHPTFKWELCKALSEIGVVWYGQAMYDSWPIDRRHGEIILEMSLGGVGDGRMMDDSDMDRVNSRMQPFRFLGEYRFRVWSITQHGINRNVWFKIHFWK